jgi:hypothetical protein
MGTTDTKIWGPSFKHSWGTTAVLPGKFGGSKVAPVDGKITDYKYRWVTVGGAGTSSGNWKDTAEQDILDAGALGCAFDEEGGVSANDAMTWIKQMRAKHRTWTFVYVPQCGTPIQKYDVAAGSCDYVAPMMYYSNGDSYPGMDLTQGSGNTADCLAKISEAGWPSARTILTFQSFDAWRVSGHGAGGSGSGASVGCVGCSEGATEGVSMLMTMGKLLTDHAVTLTYWGTSNVTLQGPFAGVLGWPAQCGGSMRKCWPEMDQKNFEIVAKAAGEAPLSPTPEPAPTPPLPTPKMPTPSPQPAALYKCEGTMCVKRARGLAKATCEQLCS